MQARYQDPRIGRFLSSDPVGFADMGAAYFNRYAYVSNAPTNLIDPFGLCSTGSRIEGRSGSTGCRVIFEDRPSRLELKRGVEAAVKNFVEDNPDQFPGLDESQFEEFSKVMTSALFDSEYEARDGGTSYNWGTIVREVRHWLWGHRGFVYDTPNVANGELNAKHGLFSEKGGRDYPRGSIAFAVTPSRAQAHYSLNFVEENIPSFSFGASTAQYPVFVKNQHKLYFFGVAPGNMR